MIAIACSHKVAWFQKYCYMEIIRTTPRLPGTGLPRSEKKKKHFHFILSETNTHSTTDPRTIAHILWNGKREQLRKRKRGYGNYKQQQRKLWQLPPQWWIDTDMETTTATAATTDTTKEQLRQQWTDAKRY